MLALYLVSFLAIFLARVGVRVCPGFLELVTEFGPLCAQVELAFFLACVLTFFLACVLAFWLAYYVLVLYHSLLCSRTCFGILSSIYAGILTRIYSGILFGIHCNLLSDSIWHLFDIPSAILFSTYFGFYLAFLTAGILTVR